MLRLFAIAATFISLATANVSAADYRIIEGPGVPAKNVANVDEGLRRSLAFYEQMFGARLSQSQRIYISSDPQFLAKHYTSERNIKGRLTEYVRKLSSERRNEAAYGFMMMRASGPVFKGPNGIANKSRLWPAVAHEAFHLVQYDLAGSKARRCCNQDRVSVIGPTWLMEGSADYASHRFAAEYLGRQFESRIASAAKASRSFAGSLKDLETGKRLYRQRNGYDIGAYATHLLVERAGPRSVSSFYGALRRTSNWKSAFKSAFGVSVDDFYAEFDAATK